MIGLKRLGAFAQHFLLFTGLCFTAATATAVVLTNADTIVLTREAIAGGLLKALCVGFMTSVVLLGRDVHLNRKRKNDRTPAKIPMRTGWN